MPVSRRAFSGPSKRLPRRTCASDRRDPKRRARGAGAAGRARAHARPGPAARRRRGGRRQLPRHLRTEGRLRRPAPARRRHRGGRNGHGGRRGSRGCRGRSASRVGVRAGLVRRAGRGRSGPGGAGARRGHFGARRGGAPAGDDRALSRPLDLPDRTGRYGRRPRGGGRSRAPAHPDRQAPRRNGDRHDLERGEGGAGARSGRRPRARLRGLRRARSRAHRRRGRRGRLRRDRPGDVRREPQGAPSARDAGPLRRSERPGLRLQHGRPGCGRLALPDPPHARELHPDPRGAPRARGGRLRLDRRRQARRQDRRAATRSKRHGRRRRTSRPGRPPGSSSCFPDAEPTCRRDVTSAPTSARCGLRRARSSSRSRATGSS